VIRREEKWPNGRRELHLGAETDSFGVEVRTSHDSWDGQPPRYEVTIWRGKTNKSGSGLGNSIGEWEKAEAIGVYLYRMLADENAEAERLADERWQVTKAAMDARSAERAAEAKAARKARRAKVTAETERVERYKCPECDHVDDGEAFDQPVYECSRCGNTIVGEDGRRCPDCNIFTAKAGTIACPGCEQALDTDPDVVVGVIIDGTFMPEEEL
jgi:rubrerythrin